MGRQAAGLWAETRCEDAAHAGEGGRAGAGARRQVIAALGPRVRAQLMHAPGSGTLRAGPAREIFPRRRPGPHRCPLARRHRGRALLYFQQRPLGRRVQRVVGPGLGPTEGTNRGGAHLGRDRIIDPIDSCAPTLDRRHASTTKPALPGASSEESSRWCRGEQDFLVPRAATLKSDHWGSTGSPPGRRR